MWRVRDVQQQVKYCIVYAQISGIPRIKQNMKKNEFKKKVSTE